MTDRRHLPSLSALQAFEAAARHLSVKRAAEELAVTPTAVSHQLRRLELDLGVRLFHRRPRQLLITEEGQRLYPVLRDGFDAFAKAIRSLARSERKAIVLSATQAFAARWLLPRMAQFRARFPDFTLHLHASDDVVDLRAREVDVAIRYGHGNYPGLAVESLFADTFFPVCSPALKVRKPADLRARPLLHFEWRRTGPKTPTWGRWLKKAGIERKDTPSDVVFSEESHAIAAAIAGHGVALLSSLLVQDELTRGTLIRPFGPSLPGFHYHLVHLPETASEAGVVAIRTWLREELAGAHGVRPSV
ncbi:transcriptional regulator GcvA [Pendulispora albinea]|uniref:Transcriptional regulator GcvA n=1 Tax=Pendulispora albinea TaxID=2741071 RepID=A0ABZ2LWS6_9BACT